MNMDFNNLHANERHENMHREDDDTITATVTILGNVLFQQKDLKNFKEAQDAINGYVVARGWPTFEEQRQRPLRYKRWVDEDQHDYNSTFCDQVFTDRLTGRIVIRYDLGDPANRGFPEEEKFRRLGLDMRERVNLEDCVVKD